MNEEQYIATKERAKKRGLKGQHAYVTVRYDEPPHVTEHGLRTVDEIITTQLHMEMMSEDSLWMDVNGLRVTIYAERVKGQREPRLVVGCESEECELVREK